MPDLILSTSFDQKEFLKMWHLYGLFKGYQFQIAFCISDFLLTSRTIPYYQVCEFCKCNFWMENVVTIRWSLPALYKDHSCKEMWRKSAYPISHFLHHSILLTLHLCPPTCCLHRGLWSKDLPVSLPNLCHCQGCHPFYSSAPYIAPNWASRPPTGSI